MNKKKINYFKSADDFSVPYLEYVPDDKTKSAIVLVYEIYYGYLYYILNGLNIYQSIII